MTFFFLLSLSAQEKFGLEAANALLYAQHHVQRKQFLSLFLLMF